MVKTIVAEAVKQMSGEWPDLIEDYQNIYSFIFQCIHLYILIVHQKNNV